MIFKTYERICGYVEKILYSLGFDINEIKIRKVVANDKRIKCISSRYKILDIIKQSYCCVSYFTIPHANLTLAESLMLGIPIIAAKQKKLMSILETDIMQYCSRLIIYANLRTE